MASNTTSLPPYLQDQIVHIADDRKVIYTIVTAICLPLMWLAVALRFLARHYSSGRYGWDDYTMFFALFFGTGFIISDFLGSYYGGGRHLILLLQDQSSLISYSKNTLAAEILNPLALIGPKISLLFLYRRLFPSRGFLWSIIAVGALVGGYGICAIVVPLAQCIPLSKIWDPTVAGSCIDITAALTAFGAINIVTDAAILTMPIPMIWSLQTSLTTKLQLSGLFLTGTLVTIISIARVVYTSRINFEDPTWTQVDAVAWTTAEVCTSVISACLPTYRPLFDKTKRRQQGGYAYATEKKSSRLATGDEGMPLRNITVRTDIQSTWHDG